MFISRSRIRLTRGKIEIEKNAYLFVLLQISESRKSFVTELTAVRSTSTVTGASKPEFASFLMMVVKMMMVSVVVRIASCGSVFGLFFTVFWKTVCIIIVGAGIRCTTTTITVRYWRRVAGRCVCWIQFWKEKIWNDFKEKRVFDFSNWLFEFKTRKRSQTSCC